MTYTYIDKYSDTTGEANPGEVWSYFSNSGHSQYFLVISNNGSTCSALNLVDENKPGNIEICEIDYRVKYTNTKLLQYIYTSNLARKVVVIDEEDFADILDEIASNLNIETASDTTEPETDVNYSSCFDEIIALFGAEAFEQYSKCSYLFHILNGDKTTAEKFVNKLSEYRLKG